MDTLNFWFVNGVYHIRYAGKHYRYNNFVEAKDKIDEIAQSAAFSGYTGVNDNKEAANG